MQKSKPNKEEFPDRFYFKNFKFSKLNHLKLKMKILKGVFDLGYSFINKRSEKGLSFNSSGKPNMMMGLNEFSANEAINNLENQDIEKILRYFGEEKDAKIISKNIVKFRTTKKLVLKILLILLKNQKKKISK